MLSIRKSLRKILPNSTCKQIHLFKETIGSFHGYMVNYIYSITYELQGIRNDLSLLKLML